MRRHPGGALEQAAARPVRIPAAPGALPASDLVCDVRPWQATSVAQKTPVAGAGSLGARAGVTLFAALAECAGAPFTEEVMS